MKINLPKTIKHTWYWHWNTPVKNVYLDCTKHVQYNVFTLQYYEGRWHIGYMHDSYFNKDISTSHKSLDIAIKQLKVKLEKAYKSVITKPNYKGASYKIAVK